MHSEWIMNASHTLNSDCLDFSPENILALCHHHYFPCNRHQTTANGITIKIHNYTQKTEQNTRYILVSSANKNIYNTKRDRSLTNVMKKRAKGENFEAYQDSNSNMRNPCHKFEEVYNYVASRYNHLSSCRHWANEEETPEVKCSMNIRIYIRLDPVEVLKEKEQNMIPNW